MSNILTGFNMQGNDPIDNRIVSPSKFETLEEYLQRVPIQKRYYGLSFYALDEDNKLRHYTFQTSLIDPTIDDDEEEIERLDEELKKHVNNKEIHKTSEEIRSEIVDADIPDTIARVQWTLDQIEEAVNTVMGDIVDGASDEYNTLKKIQDKIVELRTEVESQLYGDDGGEVLKTLEQALKFLNQYKDFIVDIPDNYVNKQDIVDNLNTDDPTKVLSARQGKVLSETLTNYFDSAMASIRAETNRAINAENRIETKLDKEIDRSIKEDQRIDAKLDAEIKRSTDEDLRIDSKLDAEIERSTNEDIRIDNKLDSEINRSTAEDDRLDQKIDAETTRATTAESNLNTKIETETDRAEGEESRIEAKLDNEITRSTNKDTEHDNRLQALEGQTHEQNTDLGTTNSTFQLKYNTGNKIKHESDAISVRNAADTDYVNFIAKNATFKGDLLVEGQSFVTEAETVEIKDNLLLLNKGEVGAGVTKGIAGLEIDRGTEPNYFIIFDESDNRFKAGVEGDLWNLALRESDDNMLDGYFISWNSKDKILSTTNIVNESTPLLFGRTDYKQYSGNRTDPDGNYSSYAFISEAEGNHLYNFSGSSNWNIDTDKINFRFWKPLLGTTFKRASDNSEVLYHADIVNNLTSGGTNKVLSAEQGKLLQNSITSIQGSYLPLSGGTMKGSIRFPAESGIIGNADGTSDTYILRSFNNRLDIGAAALSTRIISNASDLLHHRLDTSYKIWDASNLDKPVRWGNDGDNPHTIYRKNLGINGTTYGFLSENNSNSTSIYAPTVAGTSGQVLTSTGGVPTWSNISSVGDSRYVLKAGDTMTGDLAFTSSGVIKKTGSNARVIDNVLTSYVSTSSDITGTLKITMPFGWNNTMMTVEISIFSYSSHSNSKYIVSGYNYNSTSSGWYNEGSSVFGTYKGAARLAYDGSKCCILIGTTDSIWHYPRVTIDKVTIHYSGYTATWEKGWEISFITDESNITSIKTITTNGAGLYSQGYLVANQNWINTNFLPLTGGTLTGQVIISAALTNPFRINNTNSSGNECFLKVQLQGTDKAAIGFLSGSGSYIHNYESSKYLFVKSDGAYFGTPSSNTRVLTTSDVQILPASYKNDPNSLPINQIFYAETQGVTGTPTANGLILSAQGNDEGMQFWTGSDRTSLYFRTKWTSYGNWIQLADRSYVSGNYLPLTGGTMSGSITIPGNSGTLVITANKTSNYVRGISFTKGSTVNSAVFGYHSTGGDGTGSIVISPYPTSASPWNGNIGLFISKGSVKIDDVPLATQTWVSSQGFLKTTPSITISNSGSGNAVTAITASGHTLTVTKGATYLTSSSLSGYATQSWVTSQGYLTSSSLSGYATQTWVNNKNYAVRESDNVLISHSNEFNFTASSNTSIAINYRGGSGSNTSAAITEYRFYNGQGSYSNVNILANSFTGSLIGNASSATKLGSSTVGGTAKPIYLSSGTATACSATVGSSTVPVYMSSGTITQCSTTLGVSITGNAATATTASNSNNLGGVAAASYVKSTSTTKVQDIQVVTTAGSTTGVLYVVLES